MKYHYITIEREYGSAGTEIARKLSQVCGIPCYGEEILEAVARRLSTSVDRIQRYEESVSNSLLYTLCLLAQASTGKAGAVSPEDRIFLEEQAEIRRLAEKGPAIFLGHCASEALKDRKGVVRVFIWADETWKRERIIREYHVAPEEAESTQKWFDKKRANYYFANTAKRWADMKNYDIVLHTSQIGVEGSVKALQGLLIQHG